MRICIITSSYPSCAGDVVQAPFLIDFIGGLKKRGHRVFVFTQERGGIKEPFLKGVEVKWFSWLGSKKPLVQLNALRPLDCLRIISLLYRGREALSPFLRENGIEACLALWVFPGGYFANHAYRVTRVPYSVWALGSDIYRYGTNPLLYRVMKRVIGEAKGVFADGFDLSKRVEARFQKKCFFLATTRKFLGREGAIQAERAGLTRFLYVGRLESVKGIDVLLESLALLKKEGGQAHLTIVGRGSLGDWAKEFVEKKRLGPNVTMVGHISDDDLISLYAASDCIVIPSRMESIPVVFSEALAFDKEMIVTDVGDLGMLGRQYGVAHVVPPENPAALMEAMKGRLERKGRCEGENGKRMELKNLFDIERSVERFLADYNEEE